MRPSFSRIVLTCADIGGVYQQVTSALSLTNPRSYNSTTVFESYGFEYTRRSFSGNEN